MAGRLRPLNCIAAFLLVLISIQFPSPSSALITGNDFNPPFPKAISDLKEAVVKGFGFQSEDIKIFGFDLRDALVGKSVAYEFDVQIDNKVLPLKLLEDVNRWEYVDLPIFQVEEDVEWLREEKGLVEKRQLDHQMPVLAPFQLAGPMELWIQDAADMRISLPHDVDAGILKKVILADGAVVTVKGARSVSLRHPVELPLPFNGSNNTTFASGLLSLSEHLRRSSSSQSGSPVSLRIVGPTSLTSPTSSSPLSSNRLKLKRLAPGLVELSASKKEAMKDDAVSTIDLREEAIALLTPDRFTTLWPLVSVNGSNSNLLGFEAILSSVLGPRANKNGTFKLLKADVSAQTFLKMNFGVEKKIKEGDGVWESFPEWRTKPESLRTHFEVLAKVDGNKVVPERVEHVDPIMGEDVISPSVHLGNMTMSRMPVVYPPPNPFLL